MRKMSKGFTLIELLTVIFIIGILATLLMANYSKSRVKARDARRKEDLAQIARALETFFQDNQYYPPSTLSGAGGSVNYLTQVDSGTKPNIQNSLVSSYIANIPKDPASTKNISESGCKATGIYCNNTSSGDKRNYLYATDYSATSPDKPQYYALFANLEDTPSASDYSTVIEYASSNYCGGISSGATVETGTPISAIPTGTSADACRAANVISAGYSVRTLP